MSKSNLLLPIGFLIIILVSGCASVSQSSPDAATVLAKKMSDDRKNAVSATRSVGIQPSTEALWQQTKTDCATALAGLDNRAQRVGAWQVGIAIVGSLSGVLGSAWAAAANHAKAAVSAASGLAGVANTAQSSVQTYMYGAQDLQATASAVRAQISQYAAQYTAATDDVTARAIVEKTSFECEFFALQKSAAGK